MDPTEEEMNAILDEDETVEVEEEAEEATAPPPRRTGEASVYKMKREFKESVAENVLDMVQKAGLDWGENYDPFDKFCGPYDCYSILGFDADKDRNNGITKKTLTKAYRKTSMKWHPDKNSSPDAKKMFQKISRANDVLGDPERKESYDYYSRANNDLYHRAFDKKIEIKFAPTTDVSIVIVFMFALLSVITFYMQHLRWYNCVKKTALGASRKLTERTGGTPQTRIAYEKGQEILQRHPKQLKRGKGATDMQILIKKNEGAFDKLIVAPILKMSGFDKHPDYQQNAVKMEMKVYEIFASETKTFGRGLHTPTYKDTFIYILFVTLPKRMLEKLTGGKAEEKKE